MLISLIFILFTSFLNNESEAIEVSSYVEKYKEMAVVEMYRSGVPASITMAQALHESGIGKSELAIHANNHFGIKCKHYWTGNKYYYKDDDTDQRGRLIASCFRSYESVFDSYIDHSNFLRNTAHYRNLFDLPKTDYTAWAKGLKRAGYATDAFYAEKLIRLIEKYDLALLDYHPNPMDNLKTISPTN